MNCTPKQLVRISELDAAIDAAADKDDDAFFTAVAVKDDFIDSQGIDRDRLEVTGREVSNCPDGKNHETLALPPTTERNVLKSTPMVSKPDNFCAFNGWASAPYPITRQQAASGLLSMREAVRRGEARLVRQGSGKYTFVGLDTVLLKTR